MILRNIIVIRVRVQSAFRDQVHFEPEPLHHLVVHTSATTTVTVEYERSGDKKNEEEADERANDIYCDRGSRFEGCYALERRHLRTGSLQ